MARILIVDDDDVWTVMLARRLEREGHQVDYSLTGETALAMIEQSKDGYELLLVDHRLGPGMDGIELLTRARAVSPSSDAILFTGLGEPNVGLLAYQAGAYRYMHKPFESQELVLTIESLLSWRETRYELDWLRILNGVVERLQQASTLLEVGQVLVQGGVELGFDRARFYRMRNVGGAITLCGICQAGVNRVLEFDHLEYPLENTIYSTVAHGQRQPTFFQGRELGPSFLSSLPHEEGQPEESLGEWVIIPFYSGDECIASLNMDNCRKVQLMHQQQRELLKLFSRQAAAACERGVRHEEQSARSQARDIVALAREGAVRRSGDTHLDALLSALHDELVSAIPFENLIVALRAKDHDWYHYSFHMERNNRLPRDWRSVKQSGLIAHVVGLSQPLFLPKDVDKYRDRHGIPQVGQHPAQSFIGVQLRAGSEIFGGIIVEHDATLDSFDHHHFELLAAVADEVAGLVHITWLDQRAEELNRPLRLLQQASYDLMVLAERQDSTFQGLWDATCVLATAEYGFGFDQAMLFLSEESGQQLRGVAGFSRPHDSNGKADEAPISMLGESFEQFIEQHRNGVNPESELGCKVHGSLIRLVSESDTFSHVLATGKPAKVFAQEAWQRLPGVFVEAYGETTYHVVPLKSVSRTIGLLVVDRRHSAGPDTDDLIPHLDALTNQVAVIYENLTQRRDQKRLIDLTYATFDAGQHTLKENLDQICEIARSLTHADRTLIYPLKPNAASFDFDVDSIGRAGEDPMYPVAKAPRPNGLTVHLLRAKEQLLVVRNVAMTELQYDSEKLAGHPYLQEEGIQAVVAVQIRDPKSNENLGMLYLDYRRPQSFTEDDDRIRHAEELAGLAALFIDRAHSEEREKELQERRRERETELVALGNVLQGSVYDVSDEREIAHLILAELPGLFAPLAVTTGINLREWQRDPTNEEPMEMRRFIYPRNSERPDRLDRADEVASIGGRAMRTGKPQNVPDVTQDPDYRPRFEGYTGTLSELDIPVLVDGQVVGALNIESPQHAAFNAHHEEMGQRFADVAALAIGNAQRQRNLRTVLQAASALTSPTEFRETLTTVAEEIRSAIPNLSLLVIWYLDPETRKPSLGSYFGVSRVAIQRESPRKRGAVKKGLEFTKPYYQPCVLSDPLFKRRSFVKEERIQSTAIFPLRVRGEAVGVMFFSYRTHHEFTAEEKRLYPILAEVVASSINDALKVHQLERERKRLRITQEVTEVITASTSAEQVLAGVRKKLESLYPRCTVCLARYSQRTGRLDMPPECGVHSLSISDDPNCFLCHLAVESLRSGKKTLRRQRHTKGKGTGHPLRSTTTVSLGATLVTGGDRANGRLLGVLLLESPHEDAFDGDDEEIIRNVARQTRIALERFEQEANERFQSNVIIRTFGATPIIHDINQYTGRILRRIERLQREPVLTDSGRQMLSELLEQTRQMSGRVMAMDLRREELTAVALGVEIPRWVEETLRERSVPINLNLDLVPDIRVEAYPKALRRAFYDLTRNAMEAMGFEAENQQLSITTRSASDLGQVEIRIHNNGSAIPLKNQSKLFNDVYSSKGEERGSGLLFVRAAIEQMGGEVWLDSSTDEKGTTFVVRLKVAGSAVDIKENDNDSPV